MTMLELKMSQLALAQSGSWRELWALARLRLEALASRTAEFFRPDPATQARREMLALARCHMRHNLSYSADLFAAVGRSKGPSVH